MTSLYIEGSVMEEDGKLLVSMETAMCLALVSYISPPLTVNIVPPVTCNDGHTKFDISFACPSSLSLSFLDKLPYPATLCRPPVIGLNDGISCIAGLSAVLRKSSFWWKPSSLAVSLVSLKVLLMQEYHLQALHLPTIPNIQSVIMVHLKIILICPENNRGLLGFRESCLAAPFETSPLVWFCEVSILRGEEDSLAQFELHLSLPVRIHNAGKYKSLLEEGGRYAEGPHFLLTDIVCAIGISIILQRLPDRAIKSYPHIEAWMSRVNADEKLLDTLRLFKARPLNCNVNYQAVTRPMSSLYKRDPTRCKSRHNNMYTQQADVDSSLNLVSSVKMMKVNQMKLLPLPDSVPLPDVPSSRKERKTQQIQSFLSAALRVCREGDIVVDFCAGSGHVGVALASCLPPTVKVILLDAKEGSLTRAREKVTELGLHNVWLIQANLGYFIAEFQVGLALHACGVASDLVLHKCLEKGANIILCPCCYGGIKTNETVKYPQSEEFRHTGLSEEGFIVLGHCADQVTQQGARSMLAVDTDRCLAAVEKGYQVELSKLEPVTCSTRNNMIIAVKE